MIENMARSVQPLLDTPFIRRTRRNHGLEHATVHMLSAHVPKLSVAGRSDSKGFWLLGDLETHQVEAAVHEALRRMRSGEAQLAVHPNCGTSLLTTSSMIGIAALAGSVGVRRGVSDYLGRVPMVIALSVLAIVFSRPLGLKFQQHFTTLGDPGDLEVLGIVRRETRGLRGGKIVAHRVATRSS